MKMVGLDVLARKYNDWDPNLVCVYILILVFLFLL